MPSRSRSPGVRSRSRSRRQSHIERKQSRRRRSPSDEDFYTRRSFDSRSTSKVRETSSSPRRSNSRLRSLSSCSFKEKRSYRRKSRSHGKRFERKNDAKSYNGKNTSNAANKTNNVHWGKPDEQNEASEGENQEPIEKPNFGLSGALAKDRVTGNTVNGVVMKWSEPTNAGIPQCRWRLYVFKGEASIATLHIYSKSAFLVGRDKTVADVLTEHASCSKQHAVIQFRLFQKENKTGTYISEVRPYILDLQSTNGTFLNGKRIESSRYIELREKDLLRFGESTREYVLLRAS